MKNSENIGKTVFTLSTDWASRYKKEHNRGPEQANYLLDDPIKGLSFLLENAFARAGGEQAGYGKIACDALSLSIEACGDYQRLISFPNAKNQVWDNFERLCNKKGIGLNRNLNEQVVKGLVKLAQESLHLNPFEELSVKVPKNTIEAFSILRNIHGIGDKVASFILRDIVSIMNLEKGIRPQDQILLQPIDRWVNGIATFIWDIPDRTPDWLIALRIISECQKYDCLPTSFNQGAWKYGSSVIKDTIRINLVMGNGLQLI